MDEVVAVAVKAVLGGVLVVTFALLTQTLEPKRFAGVFAAAPSVALASLTVTVIGKGAADARAACAGMIAGAVGFVAYGLIAPAAMRRWRPLPGSALALVAWLAVTALALPAAAATPAAAAATGVGLARAEGRAVQRPPLTLRASRLREGRPRDWAIRFGFGAGTSLIAGVVAVVAGPVVGGALLAFPAILLASLTLVAKEDGSAQSRDDARGATFGALGLVAFAVLGATCFTALATPLAFAVCTAGWAVIAVGSFLLAWWRGAGTDEAHPDEAHPSTLPS